MAESITENYGHGFTTEGLSKGLDEYVCMFVWEMSMYVCMYVCLCMYVCCSVEIKNQTRDG